MEADWILGLIGGVLIGLAGSVYLLLNGRVMGASGILGGLIDGRAQGTRGEKLAFLAGLILVPTLISLTPISSNTHVSTSAFVLIPAGLFVGIGTRLANGCTSGHGVCGISRFSLRGIVATVFYILSGGLTVVIARHLIGAI